MGQPASLKAAAFCGDEAVTFITLEDEEGFVNVTGGLACQVCDEACELSLGETAFCGDNAVNGEEGYDDGNRVASRYALLIVLR